MKTLLQNIFELEIRLRCRNQAVLKYPKSHSAVVHAGFFRSAMHGGECGVLAFPLYYLRADPTTTIIVVSPPCTIDLYVECTEIQKKRIKVE